MRNMPRSEQKIIKAEEEAYSGPYTPQLELEPERLSV